MKRIFSTLLTIIFWVGIYSQTPVPPGPISGTWTYGGSPYLIEGINTIADGTTLTIEPGVEVRWLNDSCPMWVNGSIVAIGTSGDSIKFIANDPGSTWGSIRFHSTPSTNDSSFFIYCHFENGKVFGDVPQNSGGAIGILDFNKVRIDHCTFINNMATDINIHPNPIGGAIALREASPNISNCLFKDNECYAGGAIGCYLESNPEIYNNVFTNNHAIGTGYGQGYGGAICIYVQCIPTISNNIFTGNTALNGGGAIGIVDQCYPMIDHNLFFGNTSDWIGGAIEVQDNSAPVISNNTIVNNYAEYGGGLDFYSCGGNLFPLVRNTILWHNIANYGNQVYIHDTVSVIDFQYCDIQEGHGGFGGVAHQGDWIDCFDEDPLFDGPPYFFLTWANFPDEDSTKSPCIDKGCPIMSDPDGTRCDLGYHYFDQVGIGIPEPFADNDLHVVISPNPSPGKLDVRYSLSDPSKSSGQLIRSVRLELFDINGRQVLTTGDQARPPGEYYEKLNVSNLPDGLYFVRLRAGNDQAVQKLIIRR